MNSLGCLINSDCFNPGIFLLVKKNENKIQATNLGAVVCVWTLWQCLPGRSEQKQTLYLSVVQLPVWGEDS